MGTRLRVSNLPSSETEDGLTARFRKFGGVRSVTIDSARANRRGAIVVMDTRADANQAIAALNLSNFDGCIVSVFLALASTAGESAR